MKVDDDNKVETAIGRGGEFAQLSGERMKILVTTYVYPPTSCGCSESASVLSRGLARLGHTVTVFTGYHPERKPVPEDAKLTVEAFKITGNYHYKVGIQATPEEIARFQKMLLEGDFDLIIFENWDVWCTYLAEPILGRLKPKKIIVSHGFTPHIWHPHPGLGWGLGNWLGGWPLVARTPWLMRYFERLVVLSPRPTLGRFFDHWMARATGNKKKVAVIPNGAFATEFNAPDLPDFRKDFEIGPGLMLLYVANYCDRKDQKKAVRVFRQAGLKDATLVLIGSALNDYAEEARQLDREMQAQYPAGKVVFLEKLNRRQTCAAYRAADLFLLTAWAETQPIVLMEAMASHTPWLSTDVGCVAELPGGLVVRTEEELVARLRELAGSPALRQKLTDEGWAACQQTYDWDQVVKAYDRLIKEVTGRP